MRHLKCHVAAQCFGNSTYLDTREKASAHTAGHCTSLIITCSATAWKWARVTFSSTEASVATSPAFVLGSPPAVSKMFPPCTTSSSTWVLHFLYNRGRSGREREKKKTGTLKHELTSRDRNWGRIFWQQWGNTGRQIIRLLLLHPPALRYCSEGHSVDLPAGTDPLCIRRVKDRGRKWQEEMEK